jgi:hypothetical protein
MGNEHPLLKRKLQFYLMTAGFIIITVAAIVFFLVNVRIQTVDIENCVYSAEASVLKAANIKPGTHSYGIDKAKITKAIKSANPYVTDVRIKRTGLTSLSITLTEDAPCFYIEKGGKYVVLSETLRVLAKHDSLSECAHKVNPIGLMPVAEAELGKTVVFEKPDEENPDLSLLSGEDAFEILGKISESDISGKITGIDFSNRFDLRVTYKDKYEILFGAPRSFDEKLALVIKTIAHLENPKNGYSSAKGIIHASVVGETSFEPTGVTDDSVTPNTDKPEDGSAEKK